MERPTSPLVCLSKTPRLFQEEAFVRDEEIEHVLARYGDRSALDALGLSWKADRTGLSSELPVAEDPVLVSLEKRIEERLGFGCTLPSSTFRFRRYSEGESHPPHVDVYEIDGHHLVATALLYLTDTTEGGETFFPKAEPSPCSIKPRKGRLAIWFNHAKDGTVDTKSLHQSNAVVRGEKATLAYFVYASLDAASKTPKAEEESAVVVRKQAPAGSRFVCVIDDIPEVTRQVLREACEMRGVRYEEVEPSKFDFIDAEPLPPGTMLYRPATSTRAVRVEQALVGPGVATLYVEPDGPFCDVGPDVTLFKRAGLPIPRTLWAHTTNRAMLRKAVEYVGGLPVVLKLSGGSGGIGVMRVDTLAGLFSTMDHLRASGRIPLLTEYIEGATHWRCIVVGREVVGYYRNRMREDDFRTYASEDPADYRDKPSAEIIATSIAATAVNKVELGGVDLLEHPSGRHYLLEVNFPCFFARAQLVGGHDMAGAIVEWLLKKAERLTG